MHVPLERISTRTLGGANLDRPVPNAAICTEKKRVVSFGVPVLSVQSIPVGGPGSACTFGAMMTTGMITSCGDNPPWKYARAPPLALKQANVHGVAISRALSTPRDANDVRRYEGSDVLPTPTHTRRCRSAVSPPGASIFMSS